MAVGAGVAVGQPLVGQGVGVVATVVGEGRGVGVAVAGIAVGRGVAVGGGGGGGLSVGTGSGCGVGRGVGLAVGRGLAVCVGGRVAALVGNCAVPVAAWRTTPAVAECDGAAPIMLTTTNAQMATITTAPLAANRIMPDDARWRSRASKSSTLSPLRSRSHQP